MTDFDWDQVETGGDFPEPFKFKAPGDRISGTVIRVRLTTFGGNSDTPVPELWVRQDDGTERSVAASQTVLRQKLATERPQVGDRVAVVYTGDGESKKAGFSPPKQFDVAVKRAGANGDTAPAQPEPAPVAASAAPSADSLI